MKKIRKTQDANFSDSYDDDLTGETPSRLKTVVFSVLCLTLIVSTIAYGSVDAWAMALLSVFAGLIVLLWLADSFFSREFRFSSSILQVPVLGLILIGFIQLLPLGGTAGVSGDLLSLPLANSLSVAPHATRLFTVQLCLFFIFFAAALTFLENQKRQRIMVFTIIIFGSIMGFFGIIQALANPNPNSILGMRESDAFPFATFINRHHFAAFMNMTIGLTLALLYGNSTKRDKRLLLAISLGLMGIAVIFTGSRGGMVSLLGVVAFVIVLNISGKRSEKSSDYAENESSGFQRSFLLIGSGLGLILILVCGALFFGAENWVARGIGMSNQADATNGRIHFWQTTWQVFLNHPFLGAGLDAFAVAFPRYDTWNGSHRVEHAHNEYLHILAEAGILGVICVGAFIFFLFKKGLRVAAQSGEDRFRRGTAVGALAGCLGILIHSLFDFPLRTSSNAFFFLTLVALATVATYSSKPAPPVRRRAKSPVVISEAELIQ